ncbi:MAG: Choline-sulfatase [uncultured Chloroflexi bacterium]|uniref:Choline-sulfatase n=1 Tax=uncultured Chloroflexota bacterium TaxID=166587 RepID=A0A6J4HR83_9CHLR|nr:MAG: Choline-sulfatase [uncultured Chloroflexota bacterium]
MARPNVLLIMADQLSALATSPYGNREVLTPHMQALAERGAVFQHAYCNYPICVPSRMSMLTGRLPASIGAWDNGAELPASTPTFLHHLRLAGYRTLMSGKMHFVGPDQLHGLERRLTSDIYPANYNLYRPWTEQGNPPRLANTSMAMGVKTAGVRSWTHQLEYDEEVHFRALEQLRHFGMEHQRRAASTASSAASGSGGAGRDDARPWFFCASYTHPHDPFHITQEYWDRYEGRDITLPAEAPPDHTPHESDLWVRSYCRTDDVGITRDDVYRARRGYYAMTSYFDDKVGDLLRELDRFGLRENTLVIITADHGDMCGEHRMWFKRSAREWSARIPLLIAGPGIAGGHAAGENVSLVDLYPTLLSLLGLDWPVDLPHEMDGHDLSPLLAVPANGSSGRARPDGAIVENYGAGTMKPVRALAAHAEGPHGRRRYKYIYVHDLPPQLYDLDDDPGEWHNLADHPAHAPVAAVLRDRLLAGWDGAEIERRVIASQHQRDFVKRALNAGEWTSWDYRPEFDAAKGAPRP